MTLITSTLITLGGKLRNDLELELEAVETERDVFASIKEQLTVDFCRPIHSLRLEFVLRRVPIFFSPLEASDALT